MIPTHYPLPQQLQHVMPEALRILRLLANELRTSSQKPFNPHRWASEHPQCQILPCAICTAFAGIPCLPTRYPSHTREMCQNARLAATALLLLHLSRGDTQYAHQQLQKHMLRVELTDVRRLAAEEPNYADTQVACPVCKASRQQTCPGAVTHVERIERSGRYTQLLADLIAAAPAPGSVTLNSEQDPNP